MVDPGDEPERVLRRSASALDGRGDPGHPRPFRPPGRGPRVAAATGAEVWIPRGEADELRAFPGGAARARTPGRRRRDASRLAGIDFGTIAVPGHSPATRSHTSTDGFVFSGDVLFSGFGRAHRPRRWQTRTRCLPASPAMYGAAAARDGGRCPGMARPRRSSASWRPTRSWPSCDVSGKFQAPRGTRDWYGDDARRRRRVIDAARGGVRSGRLRRGRDADLRGHRRLRPHLRRGLRRRAQGDVHLHRPQRPLADAAARGHRRASCGHTSSTA